MSISHSQSFFLFLYLFYVFHIYWILPVFTFQMLYPSPPLPSFFPSTCFFQEGAPSPNHPLHLSALADWWCCSFHEGANLSALSALSLALSLGSLCGVWCLSASILICVYMALGEPLRRHPYLVPTSQYCLGSAILLEFCVCIWGDSPREEVSVDLFYNPCSST